MLIEKVELKNIKPYKQRTFEFAPGINVLSGPNGAGKSTVFEAIGHALFGVEAQAFIGRAERFVRKGAQWGQVRVHFRADDGNRYVIERRVGAQSVWRLFGKSDEGREEVIETASARELEDELRKILFPGGRAPAGKLAHHFLNVIGPLQNEFLGPFVKKGRSRLNEFDRILGISAWREAFTESRALENEAQHRISQCESRLEEKRTRVAEYDQVIAELAGRRRELDEKKKELNAVSAELRRITDRLKGLDEIRTKLDRLENDITRQQGAVNALDQRRRAKAEALADAQKARELCQRYVEDYRTYLQAEKLLKELRERQRRAEALRKNITDLEGEIKQLTGQIESEKTTLAEQARQLDQERQNLEQQLARMEEHMRDLETKHQHAIARREAYKRFAERLDGLNDLHIRGDRARALIDEILSLKKDVDQLRARLQRRASLEREIAEEKQVRAEIDTITAKLASLRARREQYQEGQTKLAAGRCPFFEELCLNLKQKELRPTDFFQAQITSLESERRALSTKLDELKRREEQIRLAREELAALRELEERLGQMERKIEEMNGALKESIRLITEEWPEELRRWMESAPDESHRRELRDVVERIGRPEFPGDRALEKLKPALDAFAARGKKLLAELKRVVDERLAELEREATAFGQQYSAVRGRAMEMKKAGEKNRKLMQQLVARRDALQKLEQRLDEKKAAHERLIEQLKPFADVASRIEEQERIEARTRQGYSIYEQHRRQAEEFESIERELKKIAGESDRLRQELMRLEKQRDDLRAAYDEREHGAVKDRSLELTGQQARLRAELKAVGEMVSELEKKKAQMDEIRKQIRDLEREIRRYRETHRFIQDMRTHVFNRVSEQLSERFREEIGHVADRIYRVIAASDEELRWGPDYCIELVDFRDGRERVRSDEELSGGEMMNAVVALRLALLKITGSKIGFFDEPTSNLDEMRRANLAQAFRSLDVGQEEVGQAWYDQLFLISHDVAFTEITDQIIHLDRESFDERESV